MTTHYVGCYDGGPKHYECALLEVKRLRAMPTKICGPNLEQVLNAAGFYRNKEWVGLTEEEKHDCYLKIDVWSRCVEAVESKLKEKNT